MRAVSSIITASDAERERERLKIVTFYLVVGGTGAVVLVDCKHFDDFGRIFKNSLELGAFSRAVSTLIAGRVQMLAELVGVLDCV